MPAPRDIFRIEETAFGVRPPAPADMPGARRAASELDAVTTGTAQATQEILAAAEKIDLMAACLASALASKSEQEMAREISSLVTGIFEACNFQDLVGQRIGKIFASLDAVMARNADRQSAPQSLHGPRLAGDPGHVSQTEIDALFEA
jgi:chemotaxis protein CheZ